MNRRPFRARVETLETREVPSTLGALSRPRPLNGRGTGAEVAFAAIPNGSYETVSNLKGRTAGLGFIAAQVVLDFAPDQSHVTAGRMILIDQQGDRLFADVRGAFQIPRHGASHTSATLPFTVIAGTGGLAGATGRGTLHISQNVSNFNLRFTIDGTVRA